MNGMGRVLAAISLLIALLGAPPLQLGRATFDLGPVDAAAAQKTPAQLEAEYDRESNPKKRLSLGVDLMDQRFDELLDAYDLEDPEKQSDAVDNYLGALDRVEKAMNENTNLGAVKKAEIRLRRQTKNLSELRMTLSAADQAPLDKAVTRLNRLHETLLDSIMRPRK